jgi:NTP pyrophosphatase (non-canonical NTP hydrolase)
VISNGVDELLITTAEECAEVTQVISKILRFGIDDTHPVREKTNREELEVEIGDLMSMIDLLAEAGIIDVAKVHNAKLMKRIKFNEWRKYQTDRAKVLPWLGKPVSHWAQ